MKSVIIPAFLFFSLSAVANEPQLLTLEGVVTQVGQSNFKVYENALKVYQAQTNIKKARADLLPKLNLWSIAGMILDPTSIVENIPDVAPFLVPGNWFRLEETKLLYLAEKEGYRALWGNEVFIAKTLYKNILFDERLLAHIRASITDLQRVHQIIKTREIFGGVPPGSAREVEIRILSLTEDEQNLQVLLAKEYDEFTYSLGLSTDQNVVLTSIDIPLIEKLNPIDPKEYEFKLLSSSPEKRQFDHFLSVLDQIKNEIKYSFLGVSEISQGTAGGVFDGFQTPSGVGLSTQYAITVVKAQKEAMKTQQRGIIETLKRQLRGVSTQYNLDLGNYANFKKRVVLSRESKEALIRRLQLGENIDVLQLTEASRNQIQAETAMYAVQYRVMGSMDRVQRLIFEGDYSMAPPLIESLKGAQ